jgi:hypothetical protein
MKMSTEHWCNDTDRGKLKYWEKILSSRDLTLTDLGSNPGLRDEGPATNEQPDL